jgi:hypothetical protein
LLDRLARCTGEVEVSGRPRPADYTPRLTIPPPAA